MRTDIKNTVLSHTAGLTEQEVSESREKYGSNALSKFKRTSFFRKFLSGFQDPIIRILVVALFINLVFVFQTSEYLETVGILAAILIATFISALSERGGELAFDRLQEEASKTVCIVLRNGVNTVVPLDDLVVGDTVLLSAGEGIPADGILTAGSLKLSLASLNGEGNEVIREAVSPYIPEKWTPDNERILLRGSNVTFGEGKMLVLRVGDQTLYGGMSRELQTETRESPLHRRLSGLAAQMSRIGYCAAGAVAVSYLCNTFLVDVGFDFAETKRLLTDAGFVLSSCIHALMLATTTVVMAVPEGLPMMISVVLSSNIKRMQKDNVLVRKPVGIETAGSMNLLFCDKTGTLTSGKPAVFGLVTGDGTWYPSYASLKQDAPVLAKEYYTSAVCNTQSMITEQNGKHTALGGNATDRAILSSVMQDAYLLPSAEITGKKPFDSAGKYSSVTVLQNGIYYTYKKGAPEVLLPAVRYAIDRNGRRIPFDRETIEKIWHDTAKRAGRVLVLCREDADGAFAFLSLICIRDELRRGAGRAVKQLQDAGIHVVMMTGDNRETACAIAKEAGILKKQALVLTSGELAQMSDKEVCDCLPRLSVIARAIPQDKSRLVRLAQSENLTVGMTGDGVNDAPALKAADVGFSMGSGTLVAREAGDIVILDDNIRSIAKAVLYGRTVFKNIRKFIMFQMTTNLSAVGISVLCPLFGVDTPITVLQMLWLNLIMDTLGSLAFATEAPEPSTMKEPPKNRETPIFNRYMIWRVFFIGLYLLCLCLWFIGSPAIRARFCFYENPVRFLGAFFALFIFSDIANSFSARSVRINPFAGLSQNTAFVLIFSFIILCQLGMIYYGGHVFRTYPLLKTELLFLLLLAASVLLFNILMKIILRLRFKKETV